MEEAFFDVPLYRAFAQLAEFERLPDESTILRFRHRLEEHNLAGQMLATVNALLSQRGLLLKVGTVVDATLIAAPTSTKNKDKARDPEMHSSKKGNQWYMIEGHPTGWGMKGGFLWSCRLLLLPLVIIGSSQGRAHAHAADWSTQAGWAAPDYAR